MNNKINSNNYEAYYLDYLEGNLSSDMTLSLFAFLADNPELQVEDLGPELSDYSFVLDNDFKNNLKQNGNSEKIDDSNIEYFLTAEKESQLSNDKIAELDKFIETHPKYKLDRKIYSLSSIIPDEKVIYGNKRGLKKRETIALWPLLTTLAAACAVLVFWLLPNPNNVDDVQSAANTPDTRHKTTASLPTKTTDDNTGSAANTYTGFDSKENSNTSNGIAFAAEPKSVNSRLSTKRAQRLESQFAENVSFSSLPDKPVSAVAYQPTEMPEDASTTLAMKNPVQPITNKLSDIIKTQVDYKTGENKASQRKGFYLKIGSFEIYQNKKAKAKN